MFTLAILMVMTITANAMTYTQAKNEALFLSDKMAYELNLTVTQYEDVYEINLDYLMSVNGRNDVLGPWWDRRNADLRYVLTTYQYNKYVGLPYFYRPLSWNNGGWTFNIYSHYTNKSHFYNTRPTVFMSYRGGNNKKAATHYADRKPTTKPATHYADRKPTTKAAPSAKSTNNRNSHIAQNTNRGNGSGHFGARR